jgi:hypothetical protein
MFVIVLHLMTTAGYDALVIEGMREALRRRRVALVEFEVNNRGAGMWTTSPPRATGRTLSRRFHRQHEGKRTVNGTLNLLHTAGYTCFWILSHTLIRASGECWLDVFGRKLTWSNILCAHEPQVISALDGIVREGYRERTA